MVVTKSRLIYGDAIVVLALILIYFATAGFTQNVLAMGLVILVLAGRSVFWHVTHYKATGKIY